MNDIDLMEDMLHEFNKEQKEKEEEMNKKLKTDIINFIIFLDIDMEAVCKTCGINILTNDGLKYYSKLIKDNMKKVTENMKDMDELSKAALLSSLDGKEPKLFTADYPLKLEVDPRSDPFLIKTIEKSESYILPEFRKNITIASAAIPYGVLFDNLYITDDDYTFNEILEYRVPISYLCRY